MSEWHDSQKKPNRSLGQSLIELENKFNPRNIILTRKEKIKLMKLTGVAVRLKLRKLMCVCIEQNRASLQRVWL